MRISIFSKGFFVENSISSGGRPNYLKKFTTDIEDIHYNDHKEYKESIILIM
jgi:hypothetical protein